jgi:hypothetical protein
MKALLKPEKFEEMQKLTTSFGNGLSNFIQVHSKPYTLNPQPYTLNRQAAREYRW